MLNELNLTPELLEKAKSATSAAALLALAQESGITLTAEEAANYYTQLHPKEGALSDEEMDNVSGGACGDNAMPPPLCEDCNVLAMAISGSTEFECPNCGRKYHKYIFGYVA